MLLVVDTASIGVAPEPTGGVTFKVSNIEGLDPNIVLLLPIAGHDGAHALIDGMLEAMGEGKPKVDTFGPQDIPNVQ